MERVKKIIQTNTLLKCIMFSACFFVFYSIFQAAHVSLWSLGHPPRHEDRGDGVPLPQLTVLIAAYRYRYSAVSVECGGSFDADTPEHRHRGVEELISCIV